LKILLRGLSNWFRIWMPNNDAPLRRLD
jgi:hypothetical protein